MRLGPKIISVLSLVLAAIACWLVSTMAADIIEKRSGQVVAISLIEAGHDWAEVHTDGLQVHIGGMAPTEARRFNALHVAGTMVDATRIIDGTTIVPSKPLAPPKFSIEILRNDDGITLIGLVPASMDRTLMVNEIMALAEGAEVVDLLEAGDYPEPADWSPAVQVGLKALARLPRSKISIFAGEVDITAISESAREKRALEKELTQRVPKSVQVIHHITAPRPVITPFTLRFLIDGNGPRFDACSADSPRGRDRILAAAVEAGVTGTSECTLGLGVPTPDWPTAVVQGIQAVAALKGGSVTFSDADVTLVALDSTERADFDRVVGELESNLPEVFSLHSVLPEPVAVDGTGEGEGPPEFVATRSPEGQLQLRGRLNNPVVRTTIESFAKARFGVASVYTAARIDEDLPADWPVRVLAGLQALSELESGSAVIQQDYIELSGRSGNPEAQAEIARILSEKLGDSQNYKLDVTYDKALDPIAALPTPDECVGQVNAILASTKITFEPGSADISGNGVGVINDIADVLKACREVNMQLEIAGYTDSQGREEMNLELSQSRADSVLAAIATRRILTSGISAVGYGESDPIADNDTDEGREANRRIEFRLLADAEEATEPDDATGSDDPAAETATDPAADGASTPELDATSGAAGPTETPSQDADPASPDDGTEESQ